MYLTTSDIYSSYCVMSTAMASVPCGVKTYCSSMSSCCRAVSVRSTQLPNLTSPHAAVRWSRAKFHVKAMLIEPPACKGVFCTMSTTSMAAPGPGGGVLDRPAVLPGYDNKKSTVKKKPPMYRVMLHNDSSNRREYVVRVLMKVVDGLTVDDAVNVMQEAHQNGMACVIECAQEDAERYCEGLRGNGLIASVEPAGGGGEGKPSD